MDTVIAKLKDKNRIEKRQTPSGEVDCIIIQPRKEIAPGVFAEIFIPVKDFKQRFATPADLKSTARQTGYEDFVKEGII